MKRTYSYLVILIVTLIVASSISGCGTTTESTQSVSTTVAPVAPENQETATVIPQETSTPTLSCLQGIFPGLTTKTEALQILGEPVSTEVTEDDGEFYYYLSAVEEIPNTIEIKQDLVETSSALNREESINLGNIAASYGEPEKITYSYFAQGTYTYLYPQQGFSVIAEPEGGLVFWLECFVPMSLDEYLAGLGSSLPLEDPYIR